jgi:hypothetical protein
MSSGSVRVYTPDAFDSVKRVSSRDEQYERELHAAIDAGLRTRAKRRLRLVPQTRDEDPPA